MIQPKKLEDLIRERIPLGHVGNTGFYSLKCGVCNDYKDRAGFKFGGDEVGFNCFNCGHSARYEEFSGKISYKMRQALNAYGIEDSDISAVVNSAFFMEEKTEKKITLSSLTKVSTTTPTIKLPDGCLRLGHTEEFIDYQQKLVEYLLSRHIDIDRYPFYFSLSNRLINRVIIPFYRNNHLIFWQARHIDNDVKLRYDASPNSKEAVLFNFDQLSTYKNTPLFVTEGVFDAMMFDGIAIMGSKLNDAKIKLLKQCRRRIVFVIDKDMNGAALAEKVLEHEWEITFTPDGTDDLNESVCRFGKSETAYEIMKNIPRDAHEAKLKISMRCR